MAASSGAGDGRPSFSSADAAPAITELQATAQRIADQICRDPLKVDGSSKDTFCIFDGVDDALRSDLLRLAKADPVADRAVGAMLGLACGDFIGHFFEFVPVGKKGCRFFAKTLEMEGSYNKFKLKPGQWTDDTAMSLCIADSLLVCEGYNGTDIRNRFWNWWECGYNNAFRFDTTRNSSVGLGGNIGESLRAIKDSYPHPRYEADTEDAGNGSIMRLAPVPIYFHAEEELAICACVESSYTTHPGSLAADACAFLGFLTVRALTLGPIATDLTAAQFLDQCVQAYLQRADAKSQPELVKLLKSEEPPGSTERCWNWRDPAGPFLLETCTARGRLYNGYPVNKAYFGAFCMDGLAMALHSIYHTTTLMSALECCINFLGDADSTAAICGQIAGAFYGADAVPMQVRELLERWDNKEIALRGALLAVLGSMRPSNSSIGGCELLPLNMEAPPPRPSAVEAEEHRKQGNQLYKQGKYPEALEMYDRAIEKEPHELSLYAHKCAAWLEMGEDHYNSILVLCQDLIARRDAINAANPGGASFQKVAKLYSRMATVHDNRNEWAQARRLYMKSMTLHNRQHVRDELWYLDDAEQKARQKELMSSKHVAASEGSADAGRPENLETAARVHQAVERPTFNRATFEEQMEIGRTLEYGDTLIKIMRGLETDLIAEGLWLGQTGDACYIPFLKHAGITKIVNCAAEIERPELEGIEVFWLKWRDSEEQGKSEAKGGFRRLRQATQFMKESLEAGEVVLVHCVQGISRSASVVVAFLMEHRNMSMEDAVGLVKGQHAGALRPFPLQEMLRSFRHSLVGQ